jgi:hypothetical protein
VIHWIAPLLIGIYLGILIDLPLRSWVATKQWEQQARETPRRLPEWIPEARSFDRDSFDRDSFDRDSFEQDPLDQGPLDQNPLDQDWLVDASPDVWGTRRSGDRE